MTAIEKIDRSINQCQSLDQLNSTAHFLELYYHVYSFDSKYFRYEWNMDSKLRNRRIHLALLDGVDEDEIVMSKERASLKRLDAFVNGLSDSEMNSLWPELRPQLDGVDLSNYPNLYERVAVTRLKHSQRSQVRDFQSLLSRKAPDFCHCRLIKYWRNKPLFNTTLILILPIGSDRSTSVAPVFYFSAFPFSSTAKSMAS